MARKTQQDAAKAKAAKQKKILIVASVLFVGLLAIQGPKTLKMLSGSRSTPTVDASVQPPQSTTTAATQTTSSPLSTPPGSSVAAPTLAAPTTTTDTTSSGSQLVSAVQPTADPGQLEQFFRFASKDPFAVQAAPRAAGSSTAPKKKSSSGGAKGGGGGTSGGSGSGSGSGSGTPPSSGLTSAVLSLNGVLMAVGVGASFPSSSPLFLLQSLTGTSAKVSIVGGSYADGSAALTLAVGKPVTLQNTADGTRYTLILEPQGTQVPATGSAPAPSPGTSTTPTAPPTTTTSTTGFGG